MFSIQLILAAALGNGTRQQHAVLARVTGTSPEALTAAAAAAVHRQLDQLPGEIELAEGVEPVELFTALRNPQLLVFADDPPPADPLDDKPADNEPTEAPASVKPARRPRKRP